MGQEQAKAGQRQGSQEGLILNPPGLPLQLGLDRRVGDLLHAAVHVARAARSQAQSGVVRGLEHSGRAHDKRYEQAEPPP